MTTERRQNDNRRGKEQQSREGRTMTERMNCLEREDKS